MCRKSHMHGLCAMAFGFGLMVGYYLESWFLCSFGGLGVIFLGFAIFRRR